MIFRKKQKNAELDPEKERYALIKVAVAEMVTTQNDLPVTSNHHYDEDEGDERTEIAPRASQREIPADVVAERKRVSRGMYEVGDKVWIDYTA